MFACKEYVENEKKYEGIRGKFEEICEKYVKKFRDLAFYRDYKIGKL